MYIQYMILSILILLMQDTQTADLRRNRHETITPYDLEEEVRELVEELKSIVRAQIFVAYNDIDSFVREVYYFRDERLNEADTDIRQGYDTFNQQVATLKNLAQSAGQNVDVCLANIESRLEQLPYDIIDNLLECLALSNMEVTIIQNEAIYRINILINEANIFDFELDICAGDLLCISPLVAQIELAKINIPQKIGVEIQRASDLVDELKVLIQQCTDDKVAQFITEGSIIVNEITSCINDLLS